MILPEGTERSKRMPTLEPVEDTQRTTNSRPRSAPKERTFSRTNSPIVSRTPPPVAKLPSGLHKRKSPLRMMRLSEAERSNDEENIEAVGRGQPIPELLIRKHIDWPGLRPDDTPALTAVTNIKEGLLSLISLRFALGSLDSLRKDEEKTKFEQMHK